MILLVKRHLLVLSVTGSVLLGMCSSLCFGSWGPFGLQTNPATFSPSLSSADWVMVRMLFPRLAEGWIFLTLLQRLGDTVRTEASQLLTSPSGSSMFLSVAGTSGGGSLANFHVDTSGSVLQELKVERKSHGRWRKRENYLQLFERLSSYPQFAPTGRKFGYVCFANDSWMTLLFFKKEADVIK